MYGPGLLALGLQFVFGVPVLSVDLACLVLRWVATVAKDPRTLHRKPLNHESKTLFLDWSTPCTLTRKRENSPHEFCNDSCDAGQASWVCGLNLNYTEDRHNFPAKPLNPYISGAVQRCFSDVKRPS